MGRKMPEKPETDVKYESNEIIQNDSNKKSRKLDNSRMYQTYDTS